MSLLVLFTFWHCERPDIVLEDPVHTLDVPENSDLTQVTRRNLPTLLDILGTDCITNEFSPTGIPNCPGILQERTITVTGLPDYPGCSFTVTFLYHECEIGNLLDIAIGDYQIVSHNCQKFSDEIANTSFIDFANANNLREAFELQMFEAIEDYVIEEKLNFFPDDHFECGFGMLFQINHFASSCYRYCYELYSYNEGVALWNQIKIGGCSSECCEVHTRICTEPDGTIRKETEAVICLNCESCQDDDLFWSWEVDPCEAVAYTPGVSIAIGADPGPQPPNRPQTTDCLFSCKEID